MNFIAHCAMIGIIPISLILFALMPARRAVLFVGFGGWLFLPQRVTYAVVGLPDYDKSAAVAISILLATIIFQPQRIAKFRLTWWDLPMLVWCTVPMVSAITNNIGGSLATAAYGGVSMMLATLRTFGIAYFIGRLYFKNFDDLRALAIGFFVAGLVYMPLCLIEVRLSPQLHNWVYGNHQHDFSQSKRFGGFRPLVFMQHGLMVGMLLTSAVLCGFWLRASKSMKRLRGINVTWLVVALGFTALLSKSTGALALLLLGFGLFATIKWMRWRWCLIVVLLIAPTYMFTRGVGLWDGQNAVELARTTLNDDRAGSLAGRMRNENMFTSRAREKPVFGWSGWGRFRVYIPEKGVYSTPDGLWVIALGQHGLVGLTTITLIFLLPTLIMLGRYPPSVWSSAAFAPAAVLSIVLMLFMIDCLFNAMVGPPYMMAVGGLLTVLPKARIAHAKSQRKTKGSATQPRAQVPARSTPGVSA